VANLTITVDDEVLKRARVRAVELGTSVNAILAEHLKSFAGRDDARARATASLLALAKQNHEQGGAPRAKARGRRRWSREDLHER
jgi:plasmid stability protein